MVLPLLIIGGIVILGIVIVLALLTTLFIFFNPWIIVVLFALIGGIAYLKYGRSSKKRR